MPTMLIAIFGRVTICESGGKIAEKQKSSEHEVRCSVTCTLP
jgi:hypothetical protein